VASADLPPFPTAHRFACGRLDGRLFFVVDDRPDARCCVARRPEWNPSENLPRGPRSHLWVAPLGSAALEVTALAVFRDVYHFRDSVPGVPGQPAAWPKPVRPGCWFLLGDNAFDSRDSRYFGDLAMTAFVGRPWFVLGPPPRQRLLLP